MAIYTEIRTLPRPITAEGVPASTGASLCALKVFEDGIFFLLAVPTTILLTADRVLPQLRDLGERIPLPGLVLAGILGATLIGGVENMIVHHRQALVLSALAPDRTDREDIRLLAERIERSQDAEIAFMKRWLELRGEEVPEPDEDHAGHGHGGHRGAPHRAPGAPERDHGDHLMSGMLSDEQLEALATEDGPEFDRIFLEFMIYHHEGALDMVAELLASPGAALDSDAFDLASHVNADQRMEIGRMVAMLAARP